MQMPSIVPRQGYRELVEKTLISKYAPATVLVNGRYEVLYLSGPLVNYLEFPPGEPNLNLLAMCRPGLRTKLRIACQKSIAEQVDTEVETQLKRGSDTIQCGIHVRLTKVRQNADPLLLISFADKASAVEAVQSQGSSLSLESLASTDVEQLERDLKSNSEELGGVIEELEGANEDLKTSNEEIMSMNEELQSANEELETSKEELQSLNEELSTVNLELLDKVTELDVANNDILNLIASTEIATLFLNTELLIQRFTPPTVELLNLRSTDVGRPLTDITTRFIDDRLVSDCQKVIQGSSPIQCEIEGEHSRLYLRRILSYRSHGNEIAGVVITFVDLTDRLSLEKSLKESRDHLAAILNSAADAILTVDSTGIIASLNPATERLFGYPRDEVLGVSFSKLFPLTKKSESMELSTAIRQDALHFAVGDYHELVASRKDGTSFAVELVVSRIDHSPLFIFVIRDVSQRKELQLRILEIASDEQRRIGQELHDGTQQELAGLSLIAGTIEDFVERKIGSHSGGGEAVTLEPAELSRLMLTTSKLVSGLKETNQHVQSLSHGIMPVQIDAEGLQSALTELAKSTTVEGKIACNFLCEERFAIETNTIATHLYRIAQEAVNNAQRHGDAKTITILLLADQQSIQLEISDDGIGVDTSIIKSIGKTNRGAGLQIMEYRASVIGGVLTVVAGKTNGTIIRCVIPKKRKVQ